jgi:hypothetical protein
MHEIDISVHRVPDPLTSSDRAVLHPHSITVSELQLKSHPADAMLSPEKWVTTLQRLCAAKGLDSTCGQQLPRMFAEAGLEDVHIKRYMYPMGLWEGQTDAEKKFALHHREEMGIHIGQMIRKIGQEQDVVTKEEVDKAVEEVDKALEEWDHFRGFVFIYAVCGRKPAR